MNSLFLYVTLALFAFSYGQLLDMDRAASFRAAMLMNALQQGQQEAPPTPVVDPAVNPNAEKQVNANRGQGPEPTAAKAAGEVPAPAPAPAPGNTMNAATALGVGMALGE